MGQKGLSYGLGASGPEGLEPKNHSIQEGTYKHRIYVTSEHQHGAQSTP